MDPQERNIFKTEHLQKTKARAPRQATPRTLLNPLKVQP